MDVDATESRVLGSLTMDYTSKSILSKNLGISVDAALKALTGKGLAEGISLSGHEEDHFRLTENGRRFVDGGPRQPLTARVLDGDGGHPRVMIVDDEADITDLLKIGLERKGFSVDAYNDPVVALANVSPGKYDVAVFDIRMPRMNGFELFREFRKIDGQTRVCFMTAFEIYLAEFTRMFPDIAPVAVLKKPISIEELTRTMREFSRESRDEPIVASGGA